ncbi:hypothetical protein [Mucilaginibacter terrae]|uniref:DUF1440 domain-containing protein n=1 Tax=Mucilaginibacter terrae TaxID=1955052 RepID=A0ABU3GRH5_9SPHI|nr:hypothetical protein [Mucilaginibacter terrae]MDT3402161.1 hypothetical protein [Mucilaginibacter terrae]
MGVKQVIIAGVTGTTLMTLFSEALSRVKGHNYNEAEILSELLNRVSPLNKQQSRVAGWIGHYGVGAMFATMYDVYLNKSNTKASIINGAIFGALSGLTGAAIWHTTFKAHPNPPGVDLKNYYKQLIVAHVIFGVAAAIIYPENKPKQTLSATL